MLPRRRPNHPDHRHAPSPEETANAAERRLAELLTDPAPMHAHGKAMREAERQHHAERGIRKRAKMTEHERAERGIRVESPIPEASSRADRLAAARIARRKAESEQAASNALLRDALKRPPVASPTLPPPAPAQRLDLKKAEAQIRAARQA